MHCLNERSETAADLRSHREMTPTTLTSTLMSVGPVQQQSQAQRRACTEEPAQQVRLDITGVGVQYTTSRVMRDSGNSVAVGANLATTPEPA